LLVLYPNTHIKPDFTPHPSMLSSTFKTILSSLLLCFLITSGIPTPTHAQSTNVETILDEVEKRSSAVTWEQSQITMEIINNKGKVRSRTIKSFQFNGDDEFKSLVYFEAPANVEGTALLTLREGDDQVQKLYLPAIQRIQTITGSQRGDAFMGSDFTYEDLGQFNDGDYEATLIDSTDESYEIEAIPTGESSYDRILFFIDREYYTILEAHYFKNQTQIKRLVASDYEELDEGIRSPGKMVMHNLQSGGKTELTWSNRVVNEEIDQRYFTERMLKRGL